MVKSSWKQKASDIINSHLSWTSLGQAGSELIDLLFSSIIADVGVCGW